MKKFSLIEIKRFGDNLDLVFETTMIRRFGKKV